MVTTLLKALIVHQPILGSVQSLFVEAVTSLHQELVGFVNSLAFAKSGRFLVAGVGKMTSLFFSIFTYFAILQFLLSHIPFNFID
ncbi:hypothetical protein ACFX2I_026187 [Malus domestica]